MRQAKNSLSQLVHRAEQGQAIYIGAYGKAQAKIIAANKDEKPRKKMPGVS